MGTELALAGIEPTPLLAGPEHALRQLVRITLTRDETGPDLRLVVRTPTGTVEVPLAPLPPGASAHEVLLPEVRRPCRVELALKCGTSVVDRREVDWQPPRRWRVHLVQRSHHDVGYTNLPSAVLREHDAFLDSVLEMAGATQGYPEEAQFRLVVEQTWSVDHYLRHTSPDRAARMVSLMRSGHVELTALFGNLVTEICGHESLVRGLYHAARLRRRHGIPVVSAEHNDVPGMSWGLCQALVDAGVRILCPALPRYYVWGREALQSFWDDARLFPWGQPGAFWWEAPSGKRILLWDSHGAGGDIRATLPGLVERLSDLAVRGYAYDAIRWPVGGGGRDNAPYIEGYARTAREWNARWTYPRLICSTNARFLADIAPELPDDLPVFRGEVPGQDYPVGSTSTAAATAVSRTTHARLQAAETLAVVAAAIAGTPYQADALFDAYEDILWYDEHTWGHHFPCGPTAEATRCEKTVHAHRAAALTHDVACKAAAGLADHVRLEGDGVHLVVLNPLPFLRTGVVCTPMREIDNCGSTMRPVPPEEDPEGAGYLRGVLLWDRWHLNPPEEIVAGRFDLVDVASGESVPFEVTAVASGDDPVPDAPERAGLGQGGRRYGFMEPPSGLRHDLRFVARDVPACGYRTYRLVPRDAEPPASSADHGPAIENEFYRVEVDPGTGRIVSLVDKELGRELVDPEAAHGFGELVVRSPEGDLSRATVAEVRAGPGGPVSTALDIAFDAPGHPVVRQRVTLYRGIRRVDFAVRILKDATPLLDAHLAFPFLARQPRFRYEGVLSILEPITDYLPGSYWDLVAVQNWVCVQDEGCAILWASRDAPMVGLGGLWPGYVSPAHSCRMPERARHAPLTADALARGWIYSGVLHNNFGTNFYVTQPGSVLFRYSIASLPGEVTDGVCARFGQEVATPFETIFTERRREGTLPPSAGFLAVDGEGVLLLTCKHAEDGRGWILRLWNACPSEAMVQVRFGLAPVREARLASATEEDLGVTLECEATGFRLPVAARSVATVRVLT